MVDTFLAKTAEPVAVRKSVLTLADRGDKLEEAITEADAL